jgi:hypothetical protein
MKDKGLNQNKILSEGLLKLATRGKGSSKEENNSHQGKSTKPFYHNQNYCVECGRDTQGASGFCSFKCQGEFYGA